jgi:hypothetical protein
VQRTSRGVPARPSSLHDHSHSLETKPWAPLPVVEVSEVSAAHRVSTFVSPWYSKTTEGVDEETCDATLTIWLSRLGEGLGSGAGGIIIGDSRPFARLDEIENGGAGATNSFGCTRGDCRTGGIGDRVAAALEVEASDRLLLLCEFEAF